MALAASEGLLCPHGSGTAHDWAAAAAAGSRQPPSDGLLQAARAQNGPFAGDTSVRCLPQALGTADLSKLADHLQASCCRRPLADVEPSLGQNGRWERSKLLGSSCTGRIAMQAPT